MQIVKYILSVLAVLVTVGLAWVSLNQYLGIKAQETKNQAIQGCMELASYTFQDGKGVTTVEPIEKSYLKCLELKGY